MGTAFTMMFSSSPRKAANTISSLLYALPPEGNLYEDMPQLQTSHESNGNVSGLIYEIREVLTQFEDEAHKECNIDLIKRLLRQLHTHIKSCEVGHLSFSNWLQLINKGNLEKPLTGQELQRFVLIFSKVVHFIHETSLYIEKLANQESAESHSSISGRYRAMIFALIMLKHINPNEIGIMDSGDDSGWGDSTSG